MSLSMEEGDHTRATLEEALEEAAVLREEVKCLEHQLFEQKNRASDARTAAVHAAREEATRQCAATHAAHVEELERAHRQGVAALQGQLDAALPLAEECACLRAKVLSLEGAVTELASTAEALQALERDYDAVHAQMQLNTVHHATELGNCKTMWYKTELDRSKLEKQCACLNARLASLTPPPVADIALQKRALEEKVQAGETECVVLKAKLKALDDKPQSRSSEENLQASLAEKQLLAAQANARTDAEKLRTAHAAYERVDQQCSNLQLEVQAKSGALAAALRESAMLRNKLADLTSNAGITSTAERAELAAEWRQLEAEKKALRQQYKPVHITIVVRENSSGNVCAANDKHIESTTTLGASPPPETTSFSIVRPSEPAKEETSKGYEGHMLESILNAGSWGSWHLW